MADIITHYLFGIDVIDNLDNNEYKKCIEKNKDLFFIGCQGPDPFFYNRFTPLFKEKVGPAVGDLLHSKKTGQFIISVIDEIKKLKFNSTNFNEVFSYFMGFICHFSLDTNAHPYICHKSGAYDKVRPKTYIYRGNHKKLEMAIDTILLEEKLNIISKNYKVHKKILVLDEIPKSIQNIMGFSLYSIYGIGDGATLFNNSYKDLKRFWRFSSDPNGIKKFIFELADKTINKTGDTVYSTLSYYNCVDDKIDYMNKSKSNWCHPCYDDEVYNTSFYEIFEDGILNSKYLIQNAIKYLKNDIDKENLKYIYKDISYSTGKSCDDRTKMKYFNSLF